MSTNLTRTAAVGGLLLAIFVGGLAVAQELSEKYVDSKYDFTITVTEPWKPSALKDDTVPGVARVAYSQPDGSSIVAIPRERNVLVALLTSSRDKFDERRQSFKEALCTLIVGGKQTSEQNVSGS